MSNLDKLHNELLDAIEPNFAKGVGASFLDIPKGWSSLVLELHTRLSELDPNYILFQAKEKNGGLQYQLDMDFTFPDDMPYDEAEALIDGRALMLDVLEDIVFEYQERSLKTCQGCGDDGEQRDVGVIATLCTDCFNKSEHGY